MGFEIFTEVIPELRELSDATIGEHYRKWMNAAEQDDIRDWLRRPLSDEERRTIQTRFARNWYEARGAVTRVSDGSVTP
jgi:DNA-directed RNA polymerase sigma subunit (sigma70/sigma32)